MPKLTLNDICQYRNENMLSTDLSDNVYISTETMQPNREGISSSDIVTPTTKKVKAFYPGDILVSNIRPYFKKIWRATFAGGCSNDVLVFSPKCNSEYLYWLLSTDSFFNYMMATSKGTKMPRGDKKAIMKYIVPDHSDKEQRQIASFLNPLQNKIALNNRINDYLAEMAETIVKNSVSNSHEGDRRIGDYVTPKRGKALLSKNAIAGDVPVIAGGLNPATYHNASNTVPPVLTISSSGANAGYIGLWGVPVWSSDSSFIDSNMSDNVYFWYTLLKARQKEIYDAQTGSAQPHIYPQQIIEMPMVNIEQGEICRINTQIAPLYEMLLANQAESRELSFLRDALLPKLMSGEIDVSQIELPTLPNNHLYGRSAQS